MLEYFEISIFNTFNIYIFMALPIKKLREIIFQVLYSQSFALSEEGDVCKFVMSEMKVTRKTMKIVWHRVQSVIILFKEIDNILKDLSINYHIDRISLVEKNILRLFIYEISFYNKIEPKIAIAEAIRLCRKFSTPEGANFVNAILDKLYKKIV